MNLDTIRDEEMFLDFAEGYEDRIIDNESETITLNENQAFYVRPYTNLVEWNISLGPNYSKPLTTNKQYKIPAHVVMRKGKEGSRIEHL